MPIASMNTVVMFSVAAAAAMSLSGQANAATVISLQYQTNGSPLVSAATPPTAGVVSAANFNVAQRSFVNNDNNIDVSNLVESDGTTPSGIGETTTSLGGYDNGSSINNGNQGDSNLYRGFALGGYGGNTEIDVALTGLTAGDSYTFYTYVESLFGPGGKVNGVVGSQSYFLTTATLTSFIQGTATTAATSADGNYFEFDNLTGSSTLNFALTSPTNSGFGLAGFQLVDNGPAGAGTPEPATLGLLGLAVAAVSRRRRGA